MIVFGIKDNLYVDCIDARELLRELKSNQYTVVTTCGWHFYTNKMKFLIQDAGGGCYKTNSVEFKKLLEEGQNWEQQYKEQQFKKKFKELIND